MEEPSSHKVSIAVDVGDLRAIYTVKYERPANVISISQYRPDISATSAVSVPIEDCKRDMNLSHINGITTELARLIVLQYFDRITNSTLSPHPPDEISVQTDTSLVHSIPHIQRSIEEHPDQPSLYLQLAIALREEGDASAVTAAKHFISLSRRQHRTLRIVPDNAEICCAYAIMAQVYEAMGKTQKAIACHILASKYDSTTTSRDALQRLQPEHSTIDIEDTLSHHHIKNYDDKFTFHCTMCGECCRTADYILVTPLDMYAITRSAAMACQGISTTRQLLSSAKYKTALHYTRQHGYPVCYLRPRLAERGHCHFAYSLLRREGDESSELLPFDESVGVAESQATTVQNSYGRDALGCMLGIAGMPTMCASYPVATELQQADFWHVRTMFWKRMHDKPSSKLAAAWQAEEKFVVVESSSCEAFYVKDPSKRALLTPIRNGAIVDPTMEDVNDYEVSIGEFIQGASDVSSKWEEMQWFMQLVESVASTLPIESIADKNIEQLYVNTLALVWYNFDKLSCAKSRPFRSYRRLKADIAQITWLVVNQTIAFLATANATIENYIILVERLNISVK